MMLQALPHDRHHLVDPLYARENPRFPLIHSVIRNEQAGTIFVADTFDGAATPRSAFVVTNAGFALLLGADGEDSSFDALLADAFRSGMAGLPGYLLWYAPPARWRKRFADCPPDTVWVRERARLFLPLDAPLSAPRRSALAEGLRVAAMNPDLMQAAEPLGLRLATKFWSSEEEFLAKALGIAIVDKDDRPVSLCYAAAVCDGLAEIDIATDPAYRGRGLAAEAAHAFATACRARGLTPAWDCFVANDASLRLAQSLGFAEAGRYPLYSFNVPLALPPG